MTGRVIRRDHYPTFMIIGAAKAGTTSLAAMLEQHPDVFITKPKEPHYFSHGWQTRREEYEALFDGRTESHRGEASTTYSQGPFDGSVAQRIHETIPDVRLIYLLRDPVERIRSQYLHWVDRGRENRHIDAAVREEPRYIGHSKYGEQLREYLRFFPRSQVLVLANESLKEDPQACLRKVFEFIGADPGRSGSLQAIRLNRSDQKRESRPVVRTMRDWARRHGVLRYLSPRARGRIHRSFSRPVDETKAVISAELAAYIWEQLESDRSLLETLVEPTFPMWEHG